MGLYTDTITDKDGNIIDTDMHIELPAGLYFINGRPSQLRDGDTLNGTLIVTESLDK